MLVGIINGIFTSGAGQILVFYYVYVLKKDTKEAREKSLMIMPIISIISMVLYIRKNNVTLKNIVFLIGISATFGTLGNVVMKKINPTILNIISGLFLIMFSLIGLRRVFI